jgi:hypothetical protein
MKRRKFLIALGVVPPLVLEACKKEKFYPSTPTIFTGYVIDENGKPVEGTGFQFSGNTGGFNPRSVFNLNTRTDAKGYYYLEQIIPEETGDLNFKPTVGDYKFPDGLYERQCLVNGVYRRDYEDIPWKVGEKNELDFKIIKR